MLLLVEAIFIPGFPSCKKFCIRSAVLPEAPDAAILPPACKPSSVAANLAKSILATSALTKACSLANPLPAAPTDSSKAAKA